MTEETYKVPTETFVLTTMNSRWSISQPEYSQWRCLMFGGKVNDGMQWRPLKGGEPNFFWRWMQYICFGNRWVKDK